MKYLLFSDVELIIKNLALGRFLCNVCSEYDHNCGCGYSDKSNQVTERYRKELLKIIEKKSKNVEY